MVLEWTQVAERPEHGMLVLVEAVRGSGLGSKQELAKHTDSVGQLDP